MRKINYVRAAAMLLAAVVLCFGLTGCTQLLQYAMDTQGGSNDGWLGEDGDIYTMDIFNDLPSTQSDIDPLFWVAEGKNGGKVYLLGSIHVADKSAYRIPDKIMDAYLASDALAVECDTLAFESDMMSQIQMSTTMMYSDGTTIADHVSPEVYEGLHKLIEENSDYVSSLGYTAEILDKCKPAMWQSLLDNIVVEKSGLDSKLGIDYHFLTIAHAQGKKIYEIESVEFQMNMLAGFSDGLNEMLLQSYIDNPLDEQAESTVELFNSWKIGDASVVLSEEETDYGDATPAEIAEYEALMDEYNTAMLGSRNVGMIDTAEKMLNNGDNIFYIVGMAHMVGDEGIVHGLRERGFTVTQLGGLADDGTANAGVTTAHTTAAADDDDSTATTTTADNGVTPLFGDDDDTTTGKTTKPTGSETVSTAEEEFYEDNYDLYEKMYEYFGGTTKKAS